MTPQNGVQGIASRPLPPELLILILVVATIVIGAFTFAIASFIKAGKADAESRRLRGVRAKDPLAPRLPSDDAP